MMLVRTPPTVGWVMRVEGFVVVAVRGYDVSVHMVVKSGCGRVWGGRGA